jgi:hypothetical protein
MTVVGVVRTVHCRLSSLGLSMIFFIFLLCSKLFFTFVDTEIKDQSRNTYLYLKKKAS